MLNPMISEIWGGGGIPRFFKSHIPFRLPRRRFIFQQKPNGVVFRPAGAYFFRLGPTQGLRPGLHSYAASRLGPKLHDLGSRIRWVIGVRAIVVAAVFVFVR